VTCACGQPLLTPGARRCRSCSMAHARTYRGVNRRRKPDLVAVARESARLSEKLFAYLEADGP
jgi:hypothetical protein